MFLFPYKSLPADLQTLLDAVALLDITEYRLFELAYRDWYGRPAEPEKLERDFVDYMFKSEVPFWVRRYAGKILQLARQQRLDRDELGLEWIPALPNGLRRGLRMLLGLIFLVVFLIVVANASGEWLTFTENCYFPPCY